MAKLATCDCKKMYHLIGNHELYNFDREQLNKLLHTAPGPRNSEFYSVKPAPGWRLLVLDGYQESIIGWKEGSEKWDRAYKMLAANNKNISPDSVAGGNWFDGIEGSNKRFVPFNGALGKEQLEWIRAELGDARKYQERVVLASHVILHPDACDGSTMVWDYEEALRILSEYDNVVAVICGHDHNGGYHRDGQGVHHLTLKSPLNLGEQGDSFGMMDVFMDGTLELSSLHLADLVSPEAMSLNELVPGTPTHEERLRFRPRLSHKSPAPAPAPAGEGEGGGQGGVADGACESSISEE
jgi:manganese-dependent ADP-ribose/CDP-alcohol diphosphatase